MRAVALHIAPPPFAGETREVRCGCGAIRQAPVGLAVVSCVRCGAAMGEAADVMASPAPSRTLLALAAFPTQVLGAIAFACALVWMIAFGVRDAVVVSVLAGGAACVVASGAAYRGSVAALVACAAVDVAIAVAMVLGVREVMAFVAVPAASAGAPLEIVRIVVGGWAAIAAAECVVAIPQARQFGKWVDERARGGRLRAQP